MAKAHEACSSSSSPGQSVVHTFGWMTQLLSLLNDYIFIRHPTCSGWKGCCFRSPRGPGPWIAPVIAIGLSSWEDRLERFQNKSAPNGKFQVFVGLFFSVPSYYQVLNIYQSDRQGHIFWRSYLAFNFLFVTSFWRYLFVQMVFSKNQDDLYFIWDFGLSILTTWPSYFWTLAYCRPIHLISIEFQCIDNNLGTPPKKLLLLLKLL
jgi:hypothetical protein